MGTFLLDSEERFAWSDVRCVGEGTMPASWADCFAGHGHWMGRFLAKSGIWVKRTPNRCRQCEILPFGPFKNGVLAPLSIGGPEKLFDQALFADNANANIVTNDCPKVLAGAAEELERFQFTCPVIDSR